MRAPQRHAANARSSVLGGAKFLKVEGAIRTLPPHQDSGGVSCHGGNTSTATPGLEGANVAQHQARRSEVAELGKQGTMGLAHPSS
eukprot:14527050-Alexandrium_andersonii.AAC.1